MFWSKIPFIYNHIWLIGFANKIFFGSSSRYFGVPLFLSPAYLWWNGLRHNILNAMAFIALEVWGKCMCVCEWVSLCQMWSYMGFGISCDPAMHVPWRCCDTSVETHVQNAHSNWSCDHTIVDHVIVNEHKYFVVCRHKHSIKEV